MIQDHQTNVALPRKPNGARKSPVSLPAVMIFRTALEGSEREKAEDAVREFARHNLDFAAIIEQSSVPFCIGYADGRLGMLNHAYEQLTGYTAEELHEVGWASITPPHWLEMEAKILEEQLRTRQPLRYEKEYIRKDGSIVPVELLVHLVADAEGNAEYYFSFLLDITERKNAERALRASESRFRKLFDADLMGICIPDRFGAFYEGNDEFLRIVGYSREDLEAGWVRWDTMTPPEYGALDLEHIAEAAARGSCTPYEKEYLRKDGSRVPIMCGYALLEGSQDQYVGFIQDLSAQKRAEEALRRAEKLTAAARLAAGVAHEINNPLMSVTNALYLALQDSTLNATTLEHLKLADRELTRASQVATQTLRFHRQSTSPIPVDLSEIMDSVIALFASRISNVLLERNYSTRERLLCCDSEIRQAFASVLLNSLDATKVGGKLRIRIRSGFAWDGSGAPGIRVTIADTGHGIPPAIKQRLFEPFLSTRESTSAGLGLWVTQGIVQKHGGRISLWSSADARNHGTALSIFFPLDGMKNQDGGKHAGAAAG